MSYLRIRHFTKKNTTSYTFYIRWVNNTHQLINRQTQETVYADERIEHVREYATRNNFVVVPG